MITSPQNPRIKHIRALQSSSRTRRESGSFIVEGVRLSEEALASGWSASLVLYTEQLDQRGMKVVEGFGSSGVPVELVSESVMKHASDTQSPQGILVEVQIKMPTQPEKLNFVLILDAVHDPGNLGTILRTASAVGVDIVVLAPGTVDPFAPKVMRAGMGAQFRLPIQQLAWDQVANLVAPLIIYLASAAASTPYTQVDLTAPLALIIGSEARGADPKALMLNPQPISIPMPGGSESLNTAVAAGVLLFEALRQRSHAHTSLILA